MGALVSTEGRGMISLDNRCTNSEPGTYNHECGQPAAWIGTHHNGSRQAFCES